ncbi:hypothetical protein RUND412_000613 [Rhizina undulata]
MSPHGEQMREFMATVVSCDYSVAEKDNSNTYIPKCLQSFLAMLIVYNASLPDDDRDFFSGIFTGIDALENEHRVSNIEKLKERYVKVTVPYHLFSISSTKLISKSTTTTKEATLIEF